MVLYQSAAGFILTDQFTFNTGHDPIAMNSVGRLSLGAVRVMVTVQ
jgi:hypothetical protein